MPHDYRQAFNDEALLYRVHYGMEEKPLALLPGKKLSPGDAKAICKLADLTVTGRMHLGIASLGVGTPTLFMDYQGKVEGVLRLAGIPGAIFTPEEMLDSDRLVARIRGALARALEVRRKVEVSREQLRVLARSNLDFVLRRPA